MTRAAISLLLGLIMISVSLAPVKLWAADTVHKHGKLTISIDVCTPDAEGMSSQGGALTVVSCNCVEITEPPVSFVGINDEQVLYSFIVPSSPFKPPKTS